MTAYWVNDGGDDSDGLTLAKAFTSIASMIADVAAALTTAGNIIYIVYDHNDAGTGAARVLTGPSSGYLPVKIISVDNNATPTYRKGTGNQFLSTDGAYAYTFDGAFALYGVCIASGSNILFSGDGNEGFYTNNVTAKLGAGNTTITLSPSGGRAIHQNLTVDLTAQGTTGSSQTVVANPGIVYVCGLSFINAGYRTGAIVSKAGQDVSIISGADFSGFTSGTECEISSLSGVSGTLIFNNCKTKASPTYVISATDASNNGRIEFYNCGPSDNPTQLISVDNFGTIASSTVTYRTGGATIEAVATSWSAITSALCTEDYPFYSPWIYGTIASTGSKTFTIYITNDTADFTNEEVWIELEYMGTSDTATATLGSSQRATILTAAAANVSPCADDTTSTWNGAGPSYTYKQSLAVTATVGEEGQYRLRVVCGKTSIGAASYFFIDPKVTVS